MCIGPDIEFRVVCLSVISEHIALDNDNDSYKCSSVLCTYIAWLGAVRHLPVVGMKQ